MNPPRPRALEWSGARKLCAQTHATAQNAAQDTIAAIDNRRVRVGLRMRGGRLYFDGHFELKDRESCLHIPKSGALPVAKAPSDMGGRHGEIRGFPASDPDPQNPSEGPRDATRRGARVRHSIHGENASKSMLSRKYMICIFLCSNRCKIT